MLMLMALMAMADPTPAAAQDAAAATMPVKEKKICRSEDSIGPIVPHRVCHTSTEWKQIGEAQAAHSRLEMRSLNSTPGGNPQ